MCAAANGHATCVEMLIKAGADVGKVDGAPILLQAGVDSMTRDAMGYSVADYANMFPKVWQKTRRHFNPDSKLLLKQGPRLKDDVILPIPCVLELGPYFYYCS